MWPIISHNRICQNILVTAFSNKHKKNCGLLTEFNSWSFAGRTSILILLLLKVELPNKIISKFLSRRISKKRCRKKYEIKVSLSLYIPGSAGMTPLVLTSALDGGKWSVFAVITDYSRLGLCHFRQTILCLYLLKGYNCFHKYIKFIA